MRRAAKTLNILGGIFWNGPRAAFGSIGQPLEGIRKKRSSDVSPRCCLDCTCVRKVESEVVVMHRASRVTPEVLGRLTAIRR